MVFDRIVIQFMDSFVWCFLLLVSANCMIRITTAHHEKVEVSTEVSPEVAAAAADEEATTAEVVKEKIVATPASKDLPIVKETPQSRSQRLDLLDNIFNARYFRVHHIPIATLRAVNELVQSIASNLHTAGAHFDPRSAKDSPARTPEKSNQ
ncbi:uncharacterized protein LOC129794314 [Lutzomyia longipalpis]|uniref:uncharacterized protein LOC129794314 n=1 Tax=Lutzomyia longipalpis TaxID=7200 RepID=UPI00248369F6|nr:uncharacterized protein LOC129794314 [Lutzomyia longipalpis]